VSTNICCYSGNIIYVNQDANDPNSFHNGTSWLDAYTDLQEGFHTARMCDCDQILVAEGTYKPVYTYIRDESTRSISFELIDDVAVYGGFPNSGDPNFADRNWRIHITTLSGDIAYQNSEYDNSYHVVKCEDVNNAILDGFTITAGYADGSDANVYGGGVYCKDSNNVAVKNCIIKQNNASYGGGIYFKDSNNLTLTDCNVSDNTTSIGGGMYNEISSVNLINCNFTGNFAASGGGIYDDRSSPNLINCTFKGNAIFSLYSTYGGGMDNNQSSPTIINSTFSGNSATTTYGNTYGGGISNRNSSNPNIFNCIFSNNLAQYGGAVSNDNSDPNIASCIFSKNTVGYGGGGMYNYESSAKVDNCIFNGNEAYDRGGGIYNSSSDPNITNCIFTGNNLYISQNSFGGGMHNYDCPSVSVANCLLNGNSSDYGGGISNDCSDLYFGNCTVSQNWAYYGGGMFNQNSNVNATNCIFWANMADVQYNEIYHYPSSPNVTYCDVKGGWAGDGNIDKDPCFFSVSEPTGSWTEHASYDNLTFQSTLYDSGANWSVNELAGKFVNPDVDLYDCLQFFIVSNDVNTIKVWGDVEAIDLTGKTYQIYDYHLKLESACIDAGDPDFNPDPNATDIDGEPRVFDGDANGSEIVDMGADEYYWSPADINSDGFVNFFDYAFFASAWQSDPNDNNYNEDCDLEDNNSIDYNDIALFCEDWLWQTAWAKAFSSAYDEGFGRSMSMGMGEGFFPSIEAKQAQPELTAADIEEIIKWLDELWLTDEEVRKIISEDEWLKFIEAVIQSAKEQLENSE